MDRQSDRLPRQTRCEGMRIKREIQMGASGGGQSIKAGGIAARTGRTQTCNRHDSPKPKTPLTRGGRPHNSPPAASLRTVGSPAAGPSGCLPLLAEGSLNNPRRRRVRRRITPLNLALREPTLLAKWILENNPNARVAIITDRDELDKQIERGFTDLRRTPCTTHPRFGAGRRTQSRAHIGERLCRTVGYPRKPARDSSPAPTPHCQNQCP